MFGNCWKLVIENTGLAVVAVFECIGPAHACLRSIHTYRTLRLYSLGPYMYVSSFQYPHVSSVYTPVRTRMLAVRLVIAQETLIVSADVRSNSMTPVCMSQARTSESYNLGQERMAQERTWTARS